MVALGCVATLVIGVSLFIQERDRAAVSKRAAIEMQDIRKAIRQYQMLYGRSNVVEVLINIPQKP